MEKAYDEGGKHGKMAPSVSQHSLASATSNGTLPDIVTDASPQVWRFLYVCFEGSCGLSADSVGFRFVGFPSVTRPFFLFSSSSSFCCCFFWFVFFMGLHLISAKTSFAQKLVSGFRFSFILYAFLFFFSFFLLQCLWVSSCSDNVSVLFLPLGHKILG